VQWNGAARTTTFVNSGQLTATIAGSDTGAPGTSQVTVVNPGAAASNALPFTITSAPAAEQRQLAATYTLSVSKTGPGTVTSTPAGINCGSDCWSYAAETRVTLTAMPQNKNFTPQWGGACSETTGASCTVTMNSAQSVKVTFQKK
jgi:hypothetical protein